MNSAGAKGKSVLWWGRFDPLYSRNRMLLKTFAELGWEVDVFYPLSSRTGLLESYFRKIRKPDLIWSPCFRQTDIESAAHWAARWQVPLIVDPLISSYQKEVFEREKWPPDSSKAHRRRDLESRLFAKGDIVVADTPAHADFFRDALRVAADKLSVLYVSAEDDHFRPLPFPTSTEPVEVLFYGSFLALQGVDVVVRAARMNPRAPVRWTLIGDGDLRPAMEREAAGAPNIVFEPWIDYAILPERVARAHILLGIFGTTPKADLVIPNKMFQAMAAGRPVITRTAASYRETLAGASAIGWVAPGSPEALADLVHHWSRNPAALEDRGWGTRKLFDLYFSRAKMKEKLQEILARALQA